MRITVSVWQNDMRRSIVNKDSPTNVS